MPPSARARRLFVACYPSSEAARALAQAAAALGQVEARPVAEQQIHLTALFIGSTEESELERCWASVEAAARGVVAFRLEPLTWAQVPEQGPARLIAVAAASCPGPLAELVRRLTLRLAPRAGRGQRFWPHLTLLRFPGPRSVSLPNLPPPLGSLAFDDLALVESRLTSEGAQHRRLATLRLPAPGR